MYWALFPAVHCQSTVHGVLFLVERDRVHSVLFLAERMLNVAYRSRQKGMLHVVKFCA
jgi:hypothetical protein